jgi:hypothetical protein
MKPVNSRLEPRCSRRAALAIAGLSGWTCTRGRARGTDAGPWETLSGWSVGSWDTLRGARRGLAAVREIEGGEGVLRRRDLSVSERLRAGTLVHTAALVAGLRGELVRPDERYACDGTRCERPHGAIRPTDALSLGCRGYFSALAPRLGTVMLASAFASLGLTSPAVPDEPEARVRFALRGEGWSLTVEDGVALSRGLHALATSEPGVWSEALVPRHGDPGALRGVVAADEGAAWFVGYSVGSRACSVVVFVSDCEGRPGDVALRVARDALAESARQFVPVRARTLRSDAGG